MNQTALTTLLTPILGAHTIAIVSWLVLASAVAAQIMPYLPVASANSPGWYRIAYGLTARITGSRANNAPMPPAGAEPAGGLVPTPPALKP